MLNWELLFLQALRNSRPSWDEPPDWRAALSLYRCLGPAEAAALDAVLLGMIDQDYRNPHSSAEALPFDDVQVNLPAGMAPEDLLCLECAVLVAAERKLGLAYYAYNRLLRAPRWHAMSGRLRFLNYEGPAAQRRLALTPAGRHHGALVGMALAEALRLEPEPIVRAWGPQTEAVLAAAQVEPGRGLPALLPPARQECLGQALRGAAAIDAATLEESLLQALNFSGVERAARGAVAGAQFGPLAAPRAWSSALKERLRLEEAAEALARSYTQA